MDTLEPAWLSDWMLSDSVRPPRMEAFGADAVSPEPPLTELQAPVAV